MEEKDRTRRNPDDFWDITDLIPQKPRSFHAAPSTDAVSVSLPNKEASGTPSKQEQSDTVITRYISPQGGGVRLSSVGDLIAFDEYEPKNSLLHRVSIKRQRTVYPYYQSFLKDALRLRDAEGEECSSVPYFSYVPQYDQLSEEQLRFYLYFRSEARKGTFLSVDYSYLLLYIYELLNLGARQDVRMAQRMLVRLFHAYSETFPALEGKLGDWICDFSLVHRLPPPDEGGSRLLRKVRALKEFYIPMPDGDREGCARSLLRFCTSYDYHSSKFATEEHLPLFEKHVFGAVLQAVGYFSEGERLLSALSFEDSTLARDAYAGALTVSEEKYRIEVAYCSFSRSNELRFLIGDVVKYAENKLRAYLGIKSRMTVYSLPTDLRNRLDEYFSEALPKRTIPRGKQEKHPYEALYDLPRKVFSLADAEKIEAESWNTTKELVEDFSDGSEELYGMPTAAESPISVESTPSAETSDDDLKQRLGALWDVLLSLGKGDVRAMENCARERGVMPELLVEEINEIGYEVMGDALVEERDTGYAVIEDYVDLLGS